MNRATLVTIVLGLIAGTVIVSIVLVESQPIPTGPRGFDHNELGRVRFLMPMQGGESAYACECLEKRR